MTTLEELRKSMSQAQARKARAEVLLAQAEAELTATRQKLQEEFGVTTPDEARERLRDLTEERDSAIAEAQASLEESSA